MSELVQELCRIKRLKRISKLSFHLEEGAFVEGTNKTLEETFSKNVDDLKHKWTSSVKMKLRAYRFPAHSAKKCSVSSVTVKLLLK